jgi:putative two-component system response regulator
MLAIETLEALAEHPRQLDPAPAQLLLYARDLKRLLDRERQKSHELALANAQLQAFARDLNDISKAERRRTQELEQAYLDTVRRLVRAARYKDRETGAHLKRLSHYSRVLALALGASAAEAELLATAAPMHDVGKIGVPDAVLHKPGPLNRKEWQLMAKHPAIGASLLKGSTSPLLETARQVALTHHERWDGSGYPQGLSGDKIPFAGRIVMLVDQYDALRSRRSYKPAFDHARTCDIMLNGDGRTLPQHFDPQMLEAFRAVHQDFETIHARFHD